MDNIKLAEETIKNLKDFIEVEKTLKKVGTAVAQNELCGLSIVLVERVFENVKVIKGE
jgi:hypothetical protein